MAAGQGRCGFQGTNMTRSGRKNSNCAGEVPDHAPRGRWNRKHLALREAVGIHPGDPDAPGLRAALETPLLWHSVWLAQLSPFCLLKYFSIIHG